MGKPAAPVLSYFDNTCSVPIRTDGSEYGGDLISEIVTL